MSDLEKTLRSLAARAGVDADEVMKKLTESSSGPRHFVSAQNIDFGPKKAEDERAPNVVSHGRQEMGSSTQRTNKKTPSSIAEKAPSSIEGGRRVVAPTVAPTVVSSASDVSGSHAREILAQAIRGEYRYAMLGLVLGLSAIVGGVILGLNGVAGTTSWTATAFGLESKLNDAAPGVILFIVGLFMIFFTHPKVKLDKLRG